MDAFHAHLAPEQVGWLDELTPLSIPWNEGKKLKLGYVETSEQPTREVHSPEVQVKLHECFQLKIHPRICEGQVPVKLWLCAPDGKRIEATCDWPSFKATAYPKLKPALQKKYPSFTWL
jgi:ATP-dependent helicase HrpB